MSVLLECIYFVLRILIILKEELEGLLAQNNALKFGMALLVPKVFKGFVMEENQTGCGPLELLPVRELNSYHVSFFGGVED